MLAKKNILIILVHVKLKKTRILSIRYKIFSHLLNFNEDNFEKRQIIIDLL